MNKFRYHIFACQNRRSCGSRPSCAERGGEAVLEALRAQILAKPELCDIAAVTPSGCLGPCFDGPMLVVYPEGVWYRGVCPGDVEEIINSHLLRARVVERLRYFWSSEPELVPQSG